MRVCDFGASDTSEIAVPRIEGQTVIFYAEADFLGVPYRVTGPAPTHPTGDLVYDPLPLQQDA